MSSSGSSQPSSVIPAEVLANEPRWLVQFGAPAAFIAGIVLIIAIGVRVTGLLPPHHLIALSLYALTDLLIVLTLASLWRSHACGNGLAAKIGLGLAALGYILDVPGELLTETSRRTATTLSSVGVSLFAVGMIVAGISMLIARRWHGWHRFVPLALGAYIPVVLIPSLILRRGPDLAFALLGVLYLVLGLAVRTEHTRPRQMSSNISE
ncbi:MAG TPA: hypothetical protein VIO62_14195 [Candidatus Dormibacteraeota bacterium]|jgi:hypothetical protein